MTKRNVILLLALLLTLWLAYGTQPISPLQSSQSTVLPTRQLPAMVDGKQQPIQAVKPLVLANRHIAASQFDLFASAQIIKQSPALKAVTSMHIPPKPQAIAPRPPIKYLGRIQTGDVAGVMLEVNGEVTPVQVGDILLGQYQVKSISNAAQDNAGKVQLLYLPLNLIQIIN